ncbi:mitochondrial import inner membrane translocase subunit Tim21-like [Haliotis rubra]|uniref:mitochondrial import inner membrane translocase subunit Tim21-like n=1 Tax=Haliotis rubra TaxID=36100 RepID=UPI001EE582A0|nr:mitochondrial import inner membrane translocase subunit Tim21-like [Haliotis rubra]
MNQTITKLSRLLKRVPSWNNAFHFIRSDNFYSRTSYRRLLCTSNRKPIAIACLNGDAQFTKRLQSPRFYATQKPTENKKDLVEAKEGPYSGLTRGEKVKEAGKDISYGLVILVGVGITGIIFYVVGRELFSSQSPSGIYGDALKKCMENDQLISMLGEPLKGYGEMTRRRRRRHVSHQEFESGGVKYMRMRFYVEGPHGKATVTAEMKQNDAGKYEYRYVVAELQGYPARSVLVVDNT